MASIPKKSSRNGAIAQGEYRRLILQFLASRRGSAETGEVLRYIELQFQEFFTNADYADQGKDMRWQNLAKWERKKMVGEGLLDDSERGVWSLTRAGWAAVES